MRDSLVAFVNAFNMWLTMDRHDLDTLLYAELCAEVFHLQLIPRDNTRSSLIDQIMSHYEWHGLSQDNNQLNESAVSTDSVSPPQNTVSFQPPPPLAGPFPRNDNMVRAGSAASVTQNSRANTFVANTFVVTKWIIAFATMMQ